MTYPNLKLRSALAVVALLASGCGGQQFRSVSFPDDSLKVAGWSSGAESASCGDEGPLAALRRYVATTDSTFQWEIVGEERGEDGTLLRLSLRSQEWQGIAWQHSMHLFLPHNPAHPELLLLVLRQGGASDGDGAALRTVSRSTGTAAAFLFDQPNQPLFGGLEEDPLLAYSYSQYLRTGEESWPLLVPMVLSVVRAVDAAQEVSRAAGGPGIRRYVVAGHSKRGHAAWLSGAVDARAAGIIPIAIDVLNSREQIEHHRAVAGEISGSSEIFSEVIDAADSPRGRCLMAMIDPFTYRDLLTEPKLIVLGTNDDYTPTDALNLYWDGLPGEKSVLYLPNTSHAGANAHPAVNAAAFAFVRAVAAGGSLPGLDWSLRAGDDSVTVRVTTPATSRSARVWMSHSSGRDFRGSRWSETAMVPMRSSVGAPQRSYLARVRMPAEGYAAFFVEAEFETDGEPYRLTTRIRVETRAPEARAPGAPIRPMRRR